MQLLEDLIQILQIKNKKLLKLTYKKKKILMRIREIRVIFI